MKGGIKMATNIPVKKSEKTGKYVHPLSMFEEMENWAGDVFPRGWLHPFQRTSSLLTTELPQVDVIDRESEVVVRAALPSFSKDEVEVSATDDSITIRGQKEEKEEEGKEDGEYYRREIRTENFLRTLHLPAIVDDKNAKATFKKGMLEITLPKTENAKRHTVAIEDA